MAVSNFILVSCLSPNATRPKRQAGPKCLFCERVTKPHDCHETINCEADEQCFTDEYITVNGNIFYKVGCRTIPVCNAVRGRRSEVSEVKRQQDIAVHVCEECCQGDYCNVRGCNSGPPRGTGCYHCDYVNDPFHCEQVKICQVNEQCFIEEVFTDDFRLKFNLGCIGNYICEQIHVAQGKRQGGLNAVCSSCCKDSYCNLVCGSQAETTTSKATTSQTTTSTTTSTTTTTTTTTPTTTTTTSTTTTTTPTTTTTTTTTPTTTTTSTTTTTTTTPRPPAVCYECQFEKDMSQCRHSIQCNHHHPATKEYTCFSGRVLDNGCFFTAACITREACAELKNRTQHGVTVTVEGFQYDDVECCDGVNCNHRRLVIPPAVENLHHC